MTEEFRSDLRPGDIGAIIRLHGVVYGREQGWDYTFEAYVADSLARFAVQHDDKRERIWLVDHDDDVQGCIGVVRAEPRTAQIRWLLLAPALRGRGIGRKLVTTAVEFCRAAGYDSIFLWTVRGLDAAAGIYSAAGFEVTEEKPGFYWGAQVTEQRYELWINR